MAKLMRRTWKSESVSDAGEAPEGKVNGGLPAKVKIHEGAGACV